MFGGCFGRSGRGGPHAYAFRLASSSLANSVVVLFQVSAVQQLRATRRCRPLHDWSAQQRCIFCFGFRPSITRSKYSQHSSGEIAVRRMYGMGTPGRGCSSVYYREALKPVRRPVSSRRSLLDQKFFVSPVGWYAGPNNDLCVSTVRFRLLSREQHRLYLSCRLFSGSVS